MAKFCTSCGNSLGEDQKFCNKCGAPIGASAAASIPAGTTPPSVTAGDMTAGSTVVPPAPRPVVAAPATVAPKRGSSAVKVIVAIVGFLALISVLAIGSCFYIGYKVKQKAKAIMTEARSAAGPSTSATPELHLSDGGPGSSAESAATADVPPYPGSTPTTNGGQLSAGPTGAASAQEYLTDDSVDKVESFYKDKFGSKITLTES